MTWAKELEELRAREALAEQMGGADKVARQHGRGKMDARARLAAALKRLGEDGNSKSSRLSSSSPSGSGQLSPASRARRR